MWRKMIKIKNKAPKEILICGDLRAVVQKVDLNSFDAETRLILENEYGNSEDLYQFATTLPRHRPSAWYRPKPVPGYHDFQILKELNRKWKLRRPLIIELRLGTYTTVPVWHRGKIA